MKVIAFFLSWATEKYRSLLLDGLTHFKAFLAVHCGLRERNSYPGAYVSKMSPQNPFLLELGLLTPSFSAQWGQF